MLKSVAILTVSLVVAIQSAAAQSGRKPQVIGMGGFPISKQITSMWLSGPDKRPVIMAYFCGPEGWHETEWTISSKFAQTPGWAEFKSNRATLRLMVDAETGSAEVQGWKFKLVESNTFLVMHVGELVEQVISLGIFDLPPSREGPAAMLFLHAHPEVADRIQQKCQRPQ